MVSYNIDVHLRHTEMENMYVRELIELVTNDVNGNNFNFTIYEAENLFDLTNKRVTLIVRSKNGTVVQENCKIVDAKQGKASITLAPDMFMENSIYMAEVQIWEGVNSRVTTLPFDYTVRLSLENDESIKADHRFSLLQVALQNVNDADNKSKEALRISIEAKVICDELVPKANTASQNAQEALDRALSVVTQEELANKVTADGKEANFDFMGNKVAQNGLLYVDKDISSKTDTKTIFSEGTISLTVDRFSNTADNILGNFFTLENGGIHLILQTDNTIYLQYRNGTTTTQIATKVAIKTGINNIRLEIKDKVFVIFIDGAEKWRQTILDYKSNTLQNLFLNCYGSSGTVTGTKILDCYIYNRILTPQELQRNFTVLSNAESINALSVSGKKLLLATDSHHVETRGGRTQDKINQVFYSQNGKEFIADATGKIEVNNGLEGWVNKAEIAGNTVKNYLIEQAFPHVITWNGQKDFKYANIEDGKTYTVITKVSTTSTTGNIRILRQENFGVSKFVTVSGVHRFTFTANKANATQWNSGTTNVYVVNMAQPDKTTFEYWCLVEGDGSNISDYGIPAGISSTQAIINNNGQSYPIYEPTIQGKTRILDANGNEVPEGTAGARLVSLDPVIIDLPKLGSTTNVADAIDRLTRMVTLNTKEDTFDKIVQYQGRDYIDYGNIRHWYISPSGIANPLGNGYCAKYYCVNSGYDLEQNINKVYIDGNGLIRLTTLASVTSISDRFPVTVRYQVKSPQTIQLTDEQMKAYDAFKKLISLPFPEDKVTLNDDGSVTWVDDSVEYKYTGDEPWKLAGETIDGNMIAFYYTDTTIKQNSPCVFSNLKYMYLSEIPTITVNSGRITNQNHFIIVRKEYLNTLDVDGFKLLLKDNPTSVIYKPVTPISSYIDKSIAPTILTDKINILSVESPVLPISFKATLPVDKMGELEARLQALEAKTNTQPVNLAFVDETYANSINKIEEVNQ